MADISFEQQVAKNKGFISGDHAKQQQKYNEAVKALAGKKPGDADYEKLRDAKREAAIATSEERQAAERKFYAEPVAKMMEDAEKLKELRDKPVAK